MYFKRIFTPGLSHYSYLLGDSEDMAVIDPRRDIEVYIEEARNTNKRITAIFETHRNEDYISGAVELGERTGASIYISKYEKLGHSYGEEIGEEDEFKIGRLKLKPLHTPGHTLGHLSYILYAKDEVPYMAFVGDTLFWGDVGRSDFYGEDKLPEMTGLLYDSIFKKLLPLGDHVIMMPAHGAGSSCGGEIEERDDSTLGYERRGSPALQVESKEQFVEKHGYMRLKPPYFEKIEEYNIKGASQVGAAVKLNSLRLEEIAERRHTIIDIRGKESYSGKHIQGSVFLKKDIVSAYLGWIVNTEDPIAFLSDGLSGNDLEQSYWTARRMGYDNIVGVYGDGTIAELEKHGVELARTCEVAPDEYLKAYKGATVLDVRIAEEVKDEYPFRDRMIIPLQLLSESLDELRGNREIMILCRSGKRSTVAYSILEREGINAKVVSGGIEAIRNRLNGQKEEEL